MRIKSETFELDGVGDILFERSKRAKHISISVKPVKGVRVAVPSGVSFEKALKVARSKRGWIRKHLNKMKHLEWRHKALLLNATAIDRNVAREILKNRLDALSEKHGFSYHRVFFRSQKTRWGSCSGKNNISLNVKLARLPEALIDYVILHELVHTRIKNHSKEFWVKLENIIGDAKTLNSKLNEYGIELL